MLFCIHSHQHWLHLHLASKAIEHIPPGGRQSTPVGDIVLHNIRNTTNPRAEHNSNFRLQLLLVQWTKLLARPASRKCPGEPYHLCIASLVQHQEVVYNKKLSGLSIHYCYAQEDTALGTYCATLSIQQLLPASDEQLFRQQICNSS